LNSEPIIHEKAIIEITRINNSIIEMVLFLELSEKKDLVQPKDERFAERLSKLKKGW
jgi:hypothetical protein